MMRPAILRRSGLSALLLAPLALAGCGPATYGTGQAPEMALFREVSGGLLSKEEKQRIDYQPRAPLVMPPSAEQLPAPAETADAVNADWPVDRDAEVAAATARAEDDDPFNDVNQAEYRRLKPLGEALADRPRAPSRPVNSANEDNGKADYYSDIVGGKQRREEFRKAIAESKGYSRTTERRYLTDPPLAYRQPVADEETGAAPELPPKKKGFIRRWFSSD